MSIIRRAYRRSVRALKIAARKTKARRMGLEFVPPNYLFFPRFNERSVVIDGGCGSMAELSMHLTNKYGLTAFGIDPTIKHAAALKQAEEQTRGRFRHLPLAIAAEDGSQKFFESREMESGSLFYDHTNARRLDVISYDVEAVSLRTLLRRTGFATVDLLKLDLEGAEYDLLERVHIDDLGPFAQIFVEFHHHAVDRFSARDTRRIVGRFCREGLKTFSLDDHNFLFYRT